MTSLMNRRVSQTVLRPGDYSIDRGTHVEDAELHYLLSSDWGSLTILARKGAAQWDPFFLRRPDWVEIEVWLQQVVQSMREDYGIEAEGLVQTCLDNLTLTYGSE